MSDILHGSTRAFGSLLQTIRATSLAEPRPVAYTASPWIARPSWRNTTDCNFCQQTTIIIIEYERRRYDGNRSIVVDVAFTENVKKTCTDVVHDVSTRYEQLQAGGVGRVNARRRALVFAAFDFHRRPRADSRRAVNCGSRPWRKSKRRTLGRVFETFVSFIIVSIIIIIT